VGDFGYAFHRVDFDDTPNPLSQSSSNQNVGIKHQGFALHANYFEFRFFSRLARRLRLPLCGSASARE
jgi:hypothetical protein